MKATPFILASSLFLLAAPVQSQGAAPAPGAFARTIYLIRHGAYDTAQQGDDHVVKGLTPLGIAEARLIAARLRGMPVTFTSLTSSTMARARQTARVIGQSFPNLALDADPLLCECTPRAWRADAMQGVPTLELDASEAQLNKVFGKYFVPARTAGENDIIVAHGNVIRYLVTKALGVDTKAWSGFSVAHCSLTVIRVLPDGAFKVLAVGDVGHIPPNLQSGATGNDPQLVVPARDSQ